MHRPPGKIFVKTLLWIVFGLTPLTHAVRSARPQGVTKPSPTKASLSETLVIARSGSTVASPLPGNDFLLGKTALETDVFKFSRQDIEQHTPQEIEADPFQVASQVPPKPLAAEIMQVPMTSSPLQQQQLTFRSGVVQEDV